MVASALLIAAGLLLAVVPVSALGQSGVDQYEENVPPAPGDDDASATQTETSSSGDTSSAESVDDDAAPAEEAEVSSAPATTEAAPTEAAPTETLPVTGTDAAPFALLGAAFVLVGVSLLAATRSVRRPDGSPIFMRRAGRWGRPR